MTTSPTTASTTTSHLSDAAVALVLGWPELEQVVTELADHIEGGGAPTVIVGVLRGGMVPAVMLAHRVGVRQVRGVGAVRTLTEGPRAGKTPPVLVEPNGLGDLQGEDVLVVEDVIGTGHTLAAVRDHIAVQKPATLRTAALVVNTVNWAAAHPDNRDPRQHHDLIGVTCTGWVRFPWELS